MEKRETLIITDKPERVWGSNHLADLLAAHRDHPFQPGSVHNVIVRHDSWCLLLANRGPCNCNPDIEVEEITDALRAQLRGGNLDE